MKGTFRFWLTTTACAAVVSAVFPNYTIVHRRTFNLNATFAGAEAIGDVASDGQYVCE